MLEYLEKIDDSDSVQDVWALHTKKMGNYGFDRLLYGYTRFKSGDFLGDNLDSIILSNHPIEYTETYVENRLFTSGPMVRWALENAGACSWSWLNEMMPDGTSYTAEEKRAIDFNRKMGVLAGYTISFKSNSARNRGGIGLTARPGMKQAEVEDIWKKYGREILTMNNMMHLKVTSLPYSNPNRNLTDRQREVLEWVGDGKTTQDIATIMGRTPATVEKHLRLARETLDVETTAQAVLKASFQNQIFVIES